MYQVFDQIMGHDWFFQGHENDDERFFRALDKIVRDENFSPESVGEYMRGKRPKQDDDDIDAAGKIIEDWVKKADAVREFLKSTA